MDRLTEAIIRKQLRTTYRLWWSYRGIHEVHGIMVYRAYVDIL